jgi:ribosomal protein L37AE/L43A
MMSLMTQPAEPSDSRKKQAAKIMERPEEYKVCEGCGSIVTARTQQCPSCHAYRFDGAASRVLSQAALLAKRQAKSVLSSDLA